MSNGARAAGRLRIATAVTVGVLAFGAATASATFKPERTFPVGGFPVAVATGDLNGDGNADLVTANSNSRDATVLLGNGRGGFRFKRTLKLGGQFATAVGIGRFDGNRFPDIAVGRTDIETGSVQIWRVSKPKGEGLRFKRGRVLPLGSVNPIGPNPTDIAVADIDRDGNRDVVVADRNFDVVSLFRGQGQGKFEAEQEHSVGNAPQELALGRINDGKRLDVVTANLPDDSVSVLIGRKGTPAFRPAQTFPASDGPYSVAVGNVTGDSRNDIVVNSDIDAEVTVLANTGAGFTPLPPFTLPDEASQVAVGRLAGDRRPDIAMVVRGSPPRMRLLVRRPNGDLTPGPKARRMSIDAANSDLVLARVDGDRQLDAVLSGGSLSVAAVLLHR